MLSVLIATFIAWIFHHIAKFNAVIYLSDTILCYETAENNVLRDKNS